MDSVMYNVGETREQRTVPRILIRECAYQCKTTGRRCESTWYKRAIAQSKTYNVANKSCMTKKGKDFCVDLRY